MADTNTNVQESELPTSTVGDATLKNPVQDGVIDLMCSLDELQHAGLCKGSRYGLWDED